LFQVWAEEAEIHRIPFVHHLVISWEFRSCTGSNG